MGVLLQAFYWDCPELENKEFEWWGFVKEKVKELSDTGFTALWLPPACKAANGILWAMILTIFMTLAI